MTNLYDGHLSLTTEKPDFEEWRIRRLERVIGFVAAQAEQYGRNTVFRKLSGLHDNKGCLTVRWRVEPEEGDMNLFLEAWKSYIGEGSDNIEHKMLSWVDVSSTQISYISR